MSPYIRNEADGETMIMVEDDKTAIDSCQPLCTGEFHQHTGVIDSLR